MYQLNQVRSIGWLNQADGSINLTPVMAGQSMPVQVNITRAQFDRVKGDSGLMKRLAVDSLNSRHK